MNKNEIKTIVDLHGDDWYYYYNFDGIEIKKNLKNDTTCGMYNWEKIRPIISSIASQFPIPCVFNVGCNMALYDHEMFKMGIRSIGIDRETEIEQASFYKKYVIENLKEEWGSELICGSIDDYETVRPEVNIITLFCVIYHFKVDPDIIMKKFNIVFPNHKYVVIQGNTPRVKKRGQVIAGVDGMIDILKRNGYSIHEIFEWDGYKKPVVVGKK
jgi:hypothetical protein